MKSNNEDKFTNQTVIRWSMPSYASLDTSTLEEMPPRIRLMLAEALLKRTPHIIDIRQPDEK